MAIYTDILQGGTNSHGVTVEDFNGIATDLLSDGVIGAITNTAGVAPTTGAFAVNAQGTPDMTVAVTQGVAYVTGTPTSGTSMRVRVKMDASQNVTISSNSTGGTRYDWVYIKLDADKMKDPDASASDVATLVTSRSTSASTDNGTPPTYGYCIAVITVANGASSIANASIADKRVKTGRDRVNASDQTIIGKNDTRAVRYVPLTQIANVVNNADPTGSTWTDVDCTSVTSANTFAVTGNASCKSSSTGRTFAVRPNGSTSAGTTNDTLVFVCNVINVFHAGTFTVGVDSGQVFEYQASSSDVSEVYINITGYWEYVD